MNRAALARLNQNEGMARVCARRASGWAIKGFLSANKIPIPTPNAFALLNNEKVRSVMPIEVQTTLDHLTQRIDVNHQLPGGIDLLKETNEMIKILQKLSIKRPSHGK